MKDNTQKILLYGASGHGKVIIDCLASSCIEVEAIFDDNPAIKELSSIPVIGAYSKDRYPESAMIISVGDNHIRKRISFCVEHEFAKAIHPSALISTSAVIDQGTVVIHGAVIQAATRIGRHSIINTGAIVDHDCDLGDFVHISPNASVCGGVNIGEGTHVGAGATIIQGIKIGKWVTVGAGAVVINDIPDYAVVVGCPAKIVKYNKKNI